MRKTTRATLITIITCTALAGCGGGDATPSTRTECTALVRSPDDGGTHTRSQECEVTLKDTRKVDCVLIDGNLSCDWDHVSGADKEPEQ